MAGKKVYSEEEVWGKKKTFSEEEVFGNPEPTALGRIKNAEVQGQLSNPVTGMRGALDAAANLGTGAVAAPIAGIAGLAGAALPGPQGQGAAIAQKTQEALTWNPRTAGGKAIAETIATPFTWLAGKADKAGGAVTDMTGSPTLGAAVNTGIQALPAVAGKLAQAPLKRAVANSEKAAAGKASVNSVKDATWKAANAEGYVVPPSEYNPSFVGNRLESIGGKAAIKQQAEIANQQVTNKIARREAGIEENAPLSEATLEAARERLAAPYREVAGVSPRAAQALEKLKQARADSKVYWRHYGVSADPASLKKAQSFDQRATVLEKLIDAEASRAGKPELLAQLRESRTALAKNYTVDKALNVADGNVDALVIGRMRGKGNPLSGGLKTIGDFASAFPRFARQESKVPAAGVSKSEAILSAMAGGAGAAALGPGGLLAAAVPMLAPPLARSLALSRQNPLRHQSSSTLRAGRDAAALAPLIGATGMPNSRKR